LRIDDRGFAWFHFDDASCGRQAECAVIQPE
jgi:hypothetical protein